MQLNHAIDPVLLASQPPLARSLSSMTGRRILLLQGPVGGFFKRLATSLEENGNEVSKINFNGGDWIFYRDGINYRDKMCRFPDFLTRMLRDKEIDLILMFSDCRPIHVMAREVADQMQIEIGVFEEGYIRPDYITCERGGVNAYSRCDLTEKIHGDADWRPTVVPMGNTFRHKATAAFLYFLFGTLSILHFPYYRHHKAFISRQIIWWVRAAIRKQTTKTRDRRFMGALHAGDVENFFLVALQVYDDFQIVTHSDYDDVRDFIREVVLSFAKNAPEHQNLVFKHHPMDRGYRHYGKLLADLARETGVEGRIFYHHDLHLQDVIDASLGVVVVNSTVGLESIQRGRPTCVMGRVFYKIPGLVFGKTLDDFWTESGASVPDQALAKRVRRNLIRMTQINGSFYKKTPRQQGDQVAFSNLAEPMENL